MTILVEAIHSVRPLTNTAFSAYVDWYGEVVVPALLRNGYDIIGAWKRTSGRMGDDVLLLRFEDFADYERAGKALRSDPEFLRQAGGARGFSVSESAKIAAFVPYATEQRLEKALAAKPDEPRQYMQAVLNMNSGGQAKTYDIIGQIADKLDGSDRMNLVTAYETTVGQRGELTDIWVMPSGANSLAYRAGDPLADLSSALREVAPEESIAFLNPLPYSPLQ